MKNYDDRMPSDIREKLNKLEDYARKLGFSNACYCWADSQANQEEMSESIDNCCADFSEEYDLEASLSLGAVCFLKPTIQKA